MSAKDHVYSWSCKFRVLMNLPSGSRDVDTHGEADNLRCKCTKAEPSIKYAQNTLVETCAVWHTYVAGLFWFEPWIHKRMGYVLLRIVSKITRMLNGNSSESEYCWAHYNFVISRLDFASAERSSSLVHYVHNSLSRWIGDSHKWLDGGCKDIRR